MAAVYTKYQGQLERFFGEFAHVQPNQIAIAPPDLQNLPTTLGGQILTAVSAVSFQVLFDKFNALSTDFRWAPGVSYSFSRVLETLDGTRTSGECKILAGALLGLWVFPPPFGLGQAAAAPKASLYTFENYDSAQGFISHHPMAGVRDLRPNIMHPHGNANDVTTRQPLYQWGDHKVVFYNGRLWDPSYMTTWAREEEMVAFEFTGNRHLKDADAYEVRVVTPNPAKGWLAGQLMFVRMDLQAGGWKGPYRAIG